MTVAGGAYFLWGRAELPDATRHWLTDMAVVSILCGVLLWLRVPHAKWLGVLVFLGGSGIGVRRLLIEGFSWWILFTALLPLVCVLWMAQIDYSHKYVEDEAS
jgi:hypothetical protein